MAIFGTDSGGSPGERTRSAALGPRPGQQPARPEWLLPGRPAAGDPDAGPRPADDDPTSPAEPVRAVCCSGGGIRAAAFSLGGLQQLATPPAGADTGLSWYAGADLVTAVSGGSYVASALATVQHTLRGPAHPPVFAPGSPEDNRLRAHTRYLLDTTAQTVISVLGIGYGLLLNLVAILASTFVVAKLLGLALGRHGLDVVRLADDGQSWSLHYPVGLIDTVLLLAAAGLLTYALLRVVETYHRFGARTVTGWCAVALGLLTIAGAGAALLIGVPALLTLASDVRMPTRPVSATAQGTTVAGTAAALATIVQRVLRMARPLAARVTGAGSLPTAAVTGRLRGWLHRAADRLLPWLGSALVVLLVGVAMLTWTWNMVVGRHEQSQLWWTAAAVGVLFGWQAVTDVNRTSLHQVYTRRLATAFAVTRTGAELTDAEGRFSTYAGDPGPALIVCATVNTSQPGTVPSARDAAPFTFSPHRTGISSGTMFRGVDAGSPFDLAAREQGDLPRRTWRSPHRGGGEGLSRPTAHLEAWVDGLSLIDMVGVSGAAVSPVMGRMTRPSLRLLLGVANVRLGMWLPNPTHPRWASSPQRRRGLLATLGRQLAQPGLPALLREMTGGLTLRGGWVYVTDGGHYENLGLVEALRRGATEIVVFDASGDPPFSLSTFSEAVETARADLGVELVLDDPTALAEVGATGRAGRLATRCTATYANGVRAAVYLCKAALVEDLPQDLVAWSRQHPDFPHATTGRQLYGDREFEAYRCLGQRAAAAALALMEPPPPPAPPGQAAGTVPTAGLPQPRSARQQSPQHAAS